MSRYKLIKPKKRYHYYYYYYYTTITTKTLSLRKAGVHTSFAAFPLFLIFCLCMIEGVTSLIIQILILSLTTLTIEKDFPFLKHPNRLF